MLEDIFFISMEGKKDYKIGNFTLREDISLPIYVVGGKKITLEDINPENIIFGMIKVLIDDPDNDNVDYYRDFIFTVQPKIEERLLNTAGNAEHDEHFTEALEIYNVLNLLKNNSLKYIQHIAVCYDNYSNYMYSHGRDLEAGKLEDEAYKYFKIIEDSPDKTEDSYYHLARFYLIRENYDKAVEYFKEFLNMSNDSQKKDEVMNALKDILNEGLNDEDYLTAKEIIQADRDEEAFEFIDKHLVKFPDSWSAYYLKGIALRKIKKTPEAIGILEFALELNPDSSDVYNELGLCYMDLNIFHKSEYYFYKALKNAPDDIAIMHNLALCSYKRNDKKTALKYCEIILEFNPDDLEIKNIKKLMEEEKNLD